MNTARLLMALILVISVSWAGDDRKPTDSATKIPPPKKVTYLGVYLAPVDEVLATHLQMQVGVGLVVRSVVKKSPASKANIQRFDILIRLDDQLLINTDQLSTLIRLKKAGDKVVFKIRRAGKPMSLQVVLESRDAPKPRRTWWRSDPNETPYRRFQMLPSFDPKFHAEINKLFGDKKLDDKEKADKINEILKKHGLGITAISIDKGRIAIKPKEAVVNKDLEESIKKALEGLPEATRKQMEQQLRNKDGSFRKGIRIIQTPDGPTFIIESSSSISITTEKKTED